MKNNENKSVQPLNIELVELDRLLSNDDDITDYCNDYITIDAVDGDTFIQNSKAAAVTSVTPSGNLIRNIGYYNYIKKLI